jgi:hypothetical protein
MGYDFNQFLKRYVYIIDIDRYDDEKDRMFLNKIEEVVNKFFGEPVVNLIVLPSPREDVSSKNIYAVYDNEEHPFDDGFVADVVKKTIKAFGVKIGD